MTQKLLFYATYPNQPIGYAKMGWMLSNFLANIEENGMPKYEVYYFGISNFDGQRVDRFINTKIKMIDVLEEEKKINSNELYGVDIISKFIEEIKPDIFFIYNDLIVVNRLLIELSKYPKNYKTYVYIDLVYAYERLDLIKNMDLYTDKIFVFSEFWKNNLVSMDINPEKINILYHGFSSNVLYKVPQEEARSKIGLQNDWFVILNTNRNAYRKALDISISSFLRFLKQNNMNEKIKMFVNFTFNNNEGYDILQLIQTECKKLNLSYDYIIHNSILCFPNNGYISDEYINYIYNACDIGINTCIGEGFGLCNMEQAGLDIPQIVTETGGLIDIFKPFCNGFPMLVKPVTTIHISKLQDSHGGYIDITNPDDFVKSLQYYYDNPEKRIYDGFKLGKYIRQKYNWDLILSNFEKILI